MFLPHLEIMNWRKPSGVVVEQVVRPTGLLDPPIEIRPSVNQIDDLLDEIDKRITKGDRVLVTTLTKRMAEEMDKYLHRINIKSKYIHSEVDTLERVEILRQLRLGEIDVLVGVNLLREGTGSAGSFSGCHTGCGQRRFFAQ